jgi:uncharacterized membrane protein YjjP (DUF1212 family)
MNNLTYDEQVQATNTIIEATLLMHEYGAESILIEQTSQRLGRAFKIDSVELALVSTAIIMTTFTNNRTQSVSITRRDRYIPHNDTYTTPILLSF